MGREDGYFKSGSDHPRAKLTEAVVRKIITDPRSYSKIAAEHDIAKETVAALKQGRGWKHLPRNPPPKTQFIRKGNVLVVTQSRARNGTGCGVRNIAEPDSMKPRCWPSAAIQEVRA